MPLAAADHLAIRNLYARYATAFDEGDAEAWAAVFTREGRFVRPGLDDVIGGDRLRDFARERMGEMPGLRHFVTNVAVDERPEGVGGSAYVLVLRVDGEALRIRTMGDYRDELAYEDGAWRFQVRRFRAWLPDDLVDARFSFG